MRAPLPPLSSACLKGDAKKSKQKCDGDDGAAADDDDDGEDDGDNGGDDNDFDGDADGPSSLSYS